MTVLYTRDTDKYLKASDIIDYTSKEISDLADVLFAESKNSLDYIRNRLETVCGDGEAIAGARGKEYHSDYCKGRCHGAFLSQAGNGNRPGYGVYDKEDRRLICCRRKKQQRKNYSLPES